MKKLRAASWVILILCFFSIFSLSVGDELEEDVWHRLRRVLNQAQAYFSPPNLDFRGRMREEREMKEAVAESLGKAKAAVEDSAKSAAELTTETVHKAKEKLKRRLRVDQPQNEL